MLHTLSWWKKRADLITGDQGTSLMEVLVSMIIVVLIVQMTYIMVLATTQVARSGDITAASYYAVALIESIKDKGSASGSYHLDEDSFFNGLKPPQGMEAELTITVVDEEPFLFLIEITVMWRERGEPRQLEMASIFRRDQL